MATYSNTAREVEMPNGDVVVIHNAPTGGENTTSNIKKFKYDDNGHVTESTAADAEDLNLSGYSTPTTGITAIGTSDDLQTAIGKLDHQSHIDQTNILYAVNTGVKNLLTITSTNESTGNVTFTHNDDGSVLVNSSSGSHSNVFHTLHEDKIYLKAGTYVLSGCPSGGSGSSYEIRLYSNAEQTFVECKGTPVEFTLSTDNWINAVLIRIDSTYNPSNMTFYPMICAKSVYDQDSSFMVGALPNYDLTRLESEDRASLAEVIDSGAKNMLNFDLTSLKALNTSGTWSGNSYTKNGVTFTYNDSTKTISTYGTSTADNTMFYLMNFTPTSGKSFTISGCPSGGSSTGYRFCNIGQPWLNDFGSSDTSVGDGTLKQMAIYINNSGTAVGTSSNPLTWKLMICTKAAFCVSNKFVPYCKLSKIVANLTKTITTSTTLDATGLQYTFAADASKFYRVTAWAKANGKNPETIAIATTSDALLGYSAFPTDTTNACISTSCIINTGSSATIDVKVKYNGVSSNHYVGMIVEEL